MPFYANPQINRLQILTAAIDPVSGNFSYSHTSPHFIAGWVDGSGISVPNAQLYSEWTKKIRNARPITWMNICGWDDFYLGGQNPPAGPPIFPERIAAGSSLAPATIGGDPLRMPNTVQSLNFWDMCGIAGPGPVPTNDKLFLVIVEYDLQRW